MSAVTAAILVGSTPRSGTGLNPRWIALLHEGRSYAWQLMHLQLTPAEVGDHSRDAPPGVLWRASEFEDLGGELALLLHLYAARTPEVVALARRIRHIQRRRVDLAGLDGAEKNEFQNLLRIARERGRELRMVAHIYPGSRLTDEDLLGLPDWELEVGYSAFSRDWTHAGGGRLVVRDLALSAMPDDALGNDEYEDEFAAQRARFIAPLNEPSRGEAGPAGGASASAVDLVMEALERSDELDRRRATAAGSTAGGSAAAENTPDVGPRAESPAAKKTAGGSAAAISAATENTSGGSTAAEAGARGLVIEEPPAPPLVREETIAAVRSRARARARSAMPETLTEASVVEAQSAAVTRVLQESPVVVPAQRPLAAPRPPMRSVIPVTGEAAVSPWGDRGVGTSAASRATLTSHADAWLERDEEWDEETQRRSLFERLWQRG